MSASYYVGKGGGEEEKEKEGLGFCPVVFWGSSDKSIIMKAVGVNSKNRGFPPITFLHTPFRFVWKGSPRLRLLVSTISTRMVGSPD